jgi:chromate transporter
LIYLKLFLTFLKIGAFTFGGGYAMIPLIQSEVIANGWLTNEELINFIAVSESTPGPFAVNVSTYVGAETGGIFGAVCATLGVVLPSFVIILIVAKCFAAFQQSRIVKGMMNGLRPAVVGLISSAAVSIGKTVFIPDGSVLSLISFTSLCGMIIFFIMLLLERKKLHPILIIVLSASLGVITGLIGEWAHLV